MKKQAVVWAAVLGTALMLAGCEEKQPAPKTPVAAPPTAPAPAQTATPPPPPAMPKRKSAPATTEIPLSKIPAAPIAG